MNRHVETKTAEWRWFAEASHGQEAGAPFVLLRLLPQLAPDIWGPGDRFAGFGLFDPPADYYRAGDASKRPLPFGLGWVVDPVTGWKPSEAGGAPSIHYASLTCAACHVGRVQTKPGESSYLIGAPNNEIDVRKYRHAFEATVVGLMSTDADLDRTVASVQELVKKWSDGGRSPNAFFGGWYGIDARAEADELAVYLDPVRCKALLKDFATKVQLGRLAVDKQLKTSYSLPWAPPLDGGTPGQSDGSGDLIPKLLLFREAAPQVYGYTVDAAKSPVERFLAATYVEMPFQLATATDAMSVWRQADRPFGQLDGSVRSPFVRQVAAMTAVVGRPIGVNYVNADFTTRFLHELPAPPYPFPVDLTRAQRGEALFKANCAACHRPGNGSIYGREVVDTDMNRARVVSDPSGRELLVRSFLAAIPKDYEATGPDGMRYFPGKQPEAEVVNDRSRPWSQGYAAGPLDGIWARAPYLHNGSVPTLRQLLAPGNPDSRRPTAFLRGLPEYDRVNVGFSWDAQVVNGRVDHAPTASLFDTRWDGASNRGHDREVRVDDEGRPSATAPPKRLDWSGPERRTDLEDLLEYLKNL
ncbi:c-type cytochrome [Paludisphaera rhizosphaerae]|uniref:c-type cytochrome n=1 Tax=Paludisphaera rhizosphaerae TaxID=2711216 RepID=UPI0013EA37A6|nr:c-type cytochrome [Paludisphaera rhizosphaerae]